MPESGIVHDGIEGLAVVRSGDACTVSARPFCGAVGIVARKGMVSDLARAMHAHYGLELPQSPRAVTDQNLTLVWVGYQHWLLLSDTGDGDGFDQAARERLGASAAISNQSDNRVRLRVEGPKARDVLAKGVPIDLHESVFKLGDAALTVYDHIGIQLWLALDSPSFDVLVARSYAPSLLIALGHAIASP